MHIFEIAFVFSLFMISYAYAVYPAVLWSFSIVFKKTRKAKSTMMAEASLPAVSLFISAYNEESVIEEKIINSLSLNYPGNLLEIIVISDGSTDRTDEIVSKYSGKGVVLRRYQERQGKTACLNQTVPLATGDIIIFSDANSQYDRNAVRNLVAGFDDRSVGFVTGFTRYRPGKGDGFSEGIGLYGQIEKFTKRMEGTFGSCVGADGAIFAIRKELYQPLDPADINDLVIPLSIIRQGFKGVLAEAAYCSEGGAQAEGKGEFSRQVRITSRTLRALLKNSDLLNPIKYPFFSFALFSHKIAKLLVPFSLLLLIISTLMLSTTIIFALLFLFVCLVGMPAIRFGNKKRIKRPLRLGSFVYTFTSINLAIFIGWLKFIKGETFTTWAPTQR